MKKIYLLVLSASILFLATSSVSIKRHSSHNGIVGYTGAPGSFGLCNSCHGGASAAASGITISAVPAFTNNMYMPDSLYQVTVSGSAAGFGTYGFACEILKAGNTNSGTLTANTAGGVKLGIYNAQRFQAIHTAPKAAPIANFTFGWKAPSAGTATIYAIVNAVNGNGQTSGDFPLAPVNMVLEPMPAPVDTSHIDTTGMGEHQVLAHGIRVFPNPASTLTKVNFTMFRSAHVFTSVTDMNGKEIRRGQVTLVAPGENELPVNVLGLDAGVYFISLRSGNQALGQKLMVVR